MLIKRCLLFLLFLSEELNGLFVLSLNLFLLFHHVIDVWLSIFLLFLLFLLFLKSLRSFLLFLPFIALRRLFTLLLLRCIRFFYFSCFRRVRFCWRSLWFGLALRWFLRLTLLVTFTKLLFHLVNLLLQSLHSFMLLRIRVVLLIILLQKSFVLLLPQLQLNNRTFNPRSVYVAVGESI